MRLSWSKSTATLRLLSMVLWSWYCLSAVNAHAQGVSISGQAIVNTPTSVSGIPGNAVLQAVPGAKITVCASTGGGIPCSPLVTIYSNSALTVVAPNPFTADVNGNFQIWVPASPTGYLISQTGSGIVGQLFVIGATAGGATAPNTPGIPGGNGAIYYATNYGVKANAHATYDATCTNGSNIVTSPNAHFQTVKNWDGSAGIQVGQVAWVVPAAGANTPSLLKTTVLSIDSDSQIHTVGSGTASCAASSTLVWGTDDTANLNIAWSHLISDTVNCGSLQLPVGMMIVSAAIANTLPAGGVGSPCTSGLINSSIKGVSWQVTVFVPTPDFDLTTCSGAGKDTSCFGVGIAELADFGVFGFSVNTTAVSGTTATIFHLHSPNMMYNVSCQNWAQNDPNLTAVINDFSLAYSQFGQYFACGGTGMTFTAASIAGPIIGSYAAGGIQPILVQSGSPGLDYFSNWFNGGSSSQCYVTASGFGNFFGEAVPSNSVGGAMCVDTGNVSLNGGSYIHSQAIANRIAVRATAAGVIRACGDRIIDTGAGEFAITIDATSSFYSCGNNNISGIINIVPGGVYVGPEANNGFCTGVATASSTLGLYGLGENTVTTCTSATTNLGVPARKAGTLTGLNVTASAGGVNGSSGVVTVLKNNVATTVTCTIGTGTSCQDNTHTAAVAFGDIISIQFTTQGADTLAGIKAQVILE